MSHVAQVGACVLDVTPPAGLAMAGFVARAAPAAGAHDPLTVRALVVDGTAVVVADVIGLHEDACGRIRARAAERAGLSPDALVVAATHTHGGPASMPGRLGGGEDPAWSSRLEDACVEVLCRAASARRPARLLFGHGADPGVARNRRHPGGPTDPALPVLAARGLDGGWIAVLLGYACHPVVLGPDNLLWTADYPGAVRRHVEAAWPGAACLFLTGCAGDANTGHLASASLSSAPSADRTFARAEEVGARIAAAVLAAPLSEVPASGPARARSVRIRLDVVREGVPPASQADAWRRELPGADPVRAGLLRCWIAWAEGPALAPLRPWTARVTVLDWGGVRIAALPGEVFAETALDLRRELDGMPVGGRTITAAHAEGCPGYVAPRHEWPLGGYEVAEAHRFYGMPGPFAAGSAERLHRAAARAARELRRDHGGA